MKFLVLLALVGVATALPHKESAWMRIHGKDRQPRITGGEEVVPHSLPHQVGLNIVADDGTYFCGGSLLNENTVLTAAHCCELTDNIEVILGAHEIRNTNETTQQLINASQVIIHPAWNSQQLENDICILVLAKNATLNENVKPADLPRRAQADDNFAGRNATASGWGLASDADETISPVLRKVVLPVVTNAQCRTKFGLIGIAIPLHPSNICGDGAEGRSSCSGDSGGPLTVPDNLSNPVIIGLTSFGISLGCELGYPSVFTRITSYLDWISLVSGIEIKQ